MQNISPAIEAKTNRRINLLMDPTNGCNLNCIHCGLDRPHVVHYTRQQAMSPADFGKVLQTMGPYVGSLGIGCLREPLVHPQIKNLFLLIDTHEMIRDVSLSTNGVLLDRSMADFMLSTNLDWNINISMESSIPVSYNKIRRGSTFNLIRENIENLISLREKTGNRITVNFSSVIFKTNLLEYTQLFEFAESMGVDSITPMQLQVHDGNQHLVLSENEQNIMHEVFESLKNRSEHSCLDFMHEGLNQQSDNDLSAADDQCSIMVMNQTGHIYPPGYRKAIGTILNPDDLMAIKTFYGLD